MSVDTWYNVAASGRIKASFGERWRTESAITRGGINRGSLLEQIRGGVRDVLEIVPLNDVYSENGDTYGGRNAARAIKYGIGVKSATHEGSKKEVNALWLDAEYVIRRDQFPLSINQNRIRQLMADFVDDIFPQPDDHTAVSTRLGLQQPTGFEPDPIQISRVEPPFDSMDIITAGDKRVYLRNGKIVDDASEEVKQEDKIREFKAWKESLAKPPIRRYEGRFGLVDPKSGDTGFDGEVGLFGSMDEGWRGEAKAFAREFIDALYDEDGYFDAHEGEILFDPNITDRPWTREDGVNEARAILRNIGIIDVLMGKKPAVGSAAEAGTIALFGAMLQRKTFAIFGELPPIEEMDPDQEKEYKNYERARAILQANGNYLRDNVPGGNYLLYQPDELRKLVRGSLESRERVIKDLLARPHWFETVLRRPAKFAIKNQIVLAGSSKDSRDTTYRGIPGAISRGEIIEHWAALGYTNGREYWDTKIDKVDQDQQPTNPWRVRDWDAGNYAFYREQELPTKDHSLINIELVTDATSYGATANVGLAIFRAALRGTYAVLALPAEPKQINAKGQAVKSDYSRARDLVLTQFEQFAEVAPWVRHYVRFVDTAEELNMTVDAIMEANKK